MPTSTYKQKIKLGKAERKALLSLLHELAFNAGAEHCQNKQRIQNHSDSTIYTHREILVNFIDQNDFAMKQILPDIKSGTHEACWMNYLYPNWREYKQHKIWSISLKKPKLIEQFSAKCLNVFNQYQSNLSNVNRSKSTLVYA
eukprot:354432_1